VSWLGGVIANHFGSRLLRIGNTSAVFFKNYLEGALAGMGDQDELWPIHPP